MNVYMPSDEKSRELIKFLQENFQLPNNLQEFTVIFRAGEPIKINVSYNPEKMEK